MSRGYSDEELLEEIVRLADELGETPTLKDMNELGAYNQGSYYTNFGSWSDAVEKAGLNPRTGGGTQRISREELKSELRRVRDELGRVPRKADLLDHGEYSKNPYQREFGSWGEAILAMGWEPACNRQYDQKELLDELRRLESELGHEPSKYDLKHHGRFGYGTYCREFGSWSAALRQAGVGVQSPKDISDGELLEDLMAVLEKEGRAPTKYEYDEMGCFTHGTLVRRFGSYANAVEMLGVEHDEYPTGKRHHWWNGGRAPYGPGFDEEKKQKVRIRDHARCQHCGRTEPEHIEKFGEKHSVHHIRPARTVDDAEERNAKENLITLCRGECHKTWEQMAPLRPDTTNAVAD